MGKETGARRRLGRRVGLGVLLILGLVLAESGVWASTRTAWVVAETANVRKTADTDGDIVAHVAKGEKFYVTKFSSGWAGGKTSAGKWGWVREDLLEFSHDKGRQIAAETGHGSSSASSSDSSTHHPAAWVAVADANVRSGPGLGFDKYGTLNRGAKLYILERRGEWLRCKTPGGAGWLSDSVVTNDAHIGSAFHRGLHDPPKAYIDGDVVNLRKGPSANADLISRVRGGQTVWVLERHPDWAKVKVNNGCTGWVARECLKAPNSSATVASSSGPAGFPSPSAAKSHGWRALTAWIDGDPGNVRESASTEGDVSFQLPKGTAVTVVAMEGQWCRIKTSEGQVGYVAGWALNFSGDNRPTKTVDGQEHAVSIGWVARPSINLRSGPGDNYPRTGTLALSTQVFIVGQQGDWYKVAMDNREVGWVGSWLIDTRSTRSGRVSVPGECPPTLTQRVGATLAGVSEFGREIVRSAMKHLGEPYVHGAAGDHEFDCSGLVSYVLRQHGIAAERTCPDLFHQGSPVSRDNLAPGDVVFFANTYRAGISHVGFYIGGGRFIHAANPGSGVKITSLDESYYAEKYAGARRMR